MRERIAQLESDLAAAIAARDQAAKDLARKAGAFEELAEAKALTDRHVANLKAMIEVRTRELNALMHSRSWRVTAPLRAAAAVWRLALVRLGLRIPAIMLVAGHQLNLTGTGEFQATGNDPWFTLDLPQSELPRGLARGWYVVTFRGAKSADVLSPKLYIDYGSGFSEATAVVLPEDTMSGRPAFIHILKRTARLRLDPADHPLRFRLEAIELRRVPASAVAASLVKPLIALVARTPGFARERLPKALRMWRTRGFDAVAEKLVHYVYNERRSFEHWVTLYDEPTSERVKQYRAANKQLARRPRISILLPVYNSSHRWLRRCIESVLAQTYQDWELCIADDASTAVHVTSILAEYAKRDSRIRTVRRDVNGHIAAASNSALALATGEFVALLDHDDELVPWALYWIAASIVEQPDVVFVYSDEDKINEEGRRFDPYFKPDWNPELLRAQNYPCHLSAYRRTAVADVAGFREGFDGSQDWDLALRITERCGPQRIRHIPRILYHWRSVKGSRAFRASEKEYASVAGQRAVSEALARAAVRATVERTAEGYHRIRYALPDPPPKVSIIIPTRNALGLVRTCIERLFRVTDYRSFEILLIDNQSDDPAALAYFRELGRRPNVRILRYDEPFNFSAINNFGAAAADGDILVLLNNDVEIINPDWLTELVSHACQPDNGVVGAKLLYRDETIQHAGVVVGFGGVGGHIGSREPRNFSGQMARCRIAQNITAVTGACFAVRKSVFFEAGGLDEERLQIAFNDIDFCLKVARLGYRNVWTPHAELFHQESASRGLEDTPEKQARFEREVLHMQSKWGDTLLRDPAYNPNLDLERRTFALAFPPRIGHPSP
jgi:glycosyltransferase involved in cell wall biosynthesis